MITPSFLLILRLNSQFHVVLHSYIKCLWKNTSKSKKHNFSHKEARSLAPFMCIEPTHRLKSYTPPSYRWESKRARVVILKFTCQPSKLPHVHMLFQLPCSCFVTTKKFGLMLISHISEDNGMYFYPPAAGCLTVADPGFPVGGPLTSQGGHQLPTRLRFIKCVCDNERIGTLAGRPLDPPLQANKEGLKNQS